MCSQKRNSNYATSRNYELLVRNLIKQEMSGISGVEVIEILHNARMKGSSGYEHQIDVAYRFRIWKTEMLVIVECKKYQKNVGVDDLLEFRSRIEDLKAHKGIFVSSSGFQSGAREFAEANRIALLIVRGTQSWDVMYALQFVPPSERCRYQVESLNEAYQISEMKLESRISIDHTKDEVMISHDGARVAIEPGELSLNMMYLRPAPFETAESAHEIFFDESRFGNLRTDKLLKSIILDELLLNTKTANASWQQRRKATMKAER